ncbi:phiPVL ORF41-like protein [Staphylococcus aureus]|nr:phiPVL ORF41-like protein [Staphylococcus aureus]CAA3864581.1 phiPVL ORF41-like protein [Staphylococcus aureus]
MKINKLTISNFAGIKEEKFNYRGAKRSSED